MNGSDVSFEDLIAPIELDDFLARYWEKDRLHIRRNQAGLYDEFFSMGDIDRWLATVAEGTADSIVVVPPKGTEEGSNRYAVGEISRRALYEAFSKGYSIVLNRINLSWHPLSRLTRAIGRIFHADVGVNLYLTPKGSRTFPVHFDGHDVFVLQVHGSKDWRLHEFEELPIATYSYRQNLNFPGYWSRPGDAPLLEELTLQRGDFLYIPRGMPHAAVSREETSLHLTMGVNPLYWTDLMKMAIEQTCFDVPLMRRALPPRFIEDAGIREEMRRDFETILEELRAAVSFEDVLKVAMRDRIRKQGFPGDGHFDDLLRLDQLTLDSEVEQRADVVAVVEGLEDYGVASLRFGEGHVRGPLRLRRAFEFISQNQRFRVADLPGLDAKGKVVLIRRLIRDGYLRLARDERDAEAADEKSRAVMSA